MYKKILAPFDGSPPSLHGLREAIALARDQAAQLLVLNVVEDYKMMQTGAFDAGFYTEEMINLLKADSQKLVDEAVDLAQKDGVDAQGLSVESFAARSAEVIVDQAVDHKVDLIVMGTHGRRGLGRVVMGSDAELVVRTAGVPVLLVRGPTEVAPLETSGKPAKAASSTATA